MTIYHIRIQSHLPARYSTWFDDLTITCEPSGQTLLVGELVDQAALFGVLLKVRDLGLTLLAVGSVPNKEATPMTTRPITVIAYLTVQPGLEQGFLDQFGPLVAKTRAEPGCLSYDFHQHTTEPHRFVFYENYVDQAAFDFHLNQPYTQTWIKYAAVHDAHFDVEFWTMLSQQ